MINDEINTFVIIVRKEIPRYKIEYRYETSIHTAAVLAPDRRHRSNIFLSAYRTVH